MGVQGRKIDYGVKDRVRRLAGHGTSRRQVARMTGVSRTTVDKILFMKEPLRKA